MAQINDSSHDGKLRLSYQTAGPNNAIPLIFIHGLGASSQQTISAFPKLTDRYLIAPDMPGHGITEADLQPSAKRSNSLNSIGFNHFADLVIELIDDLGFSHVDLGGLSMGSGIALNIAIRYPERVKSLILLRPSWVDQTQPDHLSLVAEVGQWIESKGVEKALIELQQSAPYQSLLMANPPVAQSIVALFDRPVTPASTAVLYQMWNDRPFPALESLLSIQQPCLILTTDKDELHPLSTADAIAQHIPHAQKQHLPARYHESEAYAEQLQSRVAQFLA